jgi:hypothetical protein
MDRLIEFESWLERFQSAVCESEPMNEAALDSRVDRAATR